MADISAPSNVLLTEFLKGRNNKLVVVQFVDDSIKSSNDTENMGDE